MKQAPLLLVILVLAGFFGPPWLSSAMAQAAANPASDLAKIYDAGMSAFAEGDYDGAISRLEQVIQQAPPDAKLESLYFTLGAAYYNLQNYPKAIDTLNTYVSKYPQGTRVSDAIFSLGQANLMTKDYQQAAAQFAKLVSVYQYREQALYLEGYALKEAGKTDDAIQALETLVGPEVRTAMGVKGGMMLVELYGTRKEVDKANAMIEKILKRPDLVENLARLNFIAVQLADSYLDAGKNPEALAAYRMVHTRDEVIAFQANRVDAIQKVHDQTLAAMRADPKNYSQYIGRINLINSLLTDARQVLDDAQKMPDFTPALYLRMARCYYDMNRKWEAAVAYEQLLDQFPQSADRETALYATMVDLAELNRPESARSIGETYLKEFPQGKNADTISYLMGATALQANDPQTAETYFGRALGERPNSSYKEQMRFMLGNAKFAEGKFDDAIRVYQEYKNDFPNGSHVEEA